MDEHSSPTSPELARAQLDIATSARVGSDLDRRIHGAAVIGFGVVMGLNVVVSDVVGNTVVRTVGGWALVLVFALVWNWRARALTVPRHTHVAVAVGFIAALAVGFPGLDLMRISTFEQPWESALSGSLVAAPMVLAGVWILIRR